MRRTALLAATLAAGPVHAHSLGPGAGDFFNGLAHPFLDPVQLLALVALGLCCAQRGIARVQWLLLGFPLLLLGAGLTGAALDWSVAGNGPVCILGAVLGLAAALARPLPLGLLYPLAGGLTVVLAGMSVNELAAQPALTPLIYLAGVALGSFLLLSYALYAADRMLAGRREWSQVVVRVVGSWIAAAALMLFSLGWVQG